ncbi:MAG: hypothetical protein J6O40_03365 [Ruminococcus sp.]|nr:hypothetical protein [Ruminococcus sp.]
MKISRNNVLKGFEVLMLFMAILLFIRFQTTPVQSGSPDQVILAFAFASMGFADFARAFRVKKSDKYEKVRYIGLGIVYFAGTAIIAAASLNTALRFSLGLYIISLVFSRIITVIKRPSKKMKVINTILALLISMTMVLPFDVDELSLFLMVMVLMPFFIMIQVFVRLLAISLSQIRFDILKKIFIKSMATEVLVGLMILIISFSLVLPTYEPSIENFRDALWYCFAIVTTIGFGDIAAVTPVGRLLSVILGVYGIIVVALVTSIIINFYTETKDVKMSDDSGDEENEEKEQEDSELSENKATE